MSQRIQTAPNMVMAFSDRTYTKYHDKARLGKQENVRFWQHVVAFLCSCVSSWTSDKCVALTPS
eukprot:4228601-Amphidinium_carterae.1